jgi:hypothetical protein
MKSPEPGKAKLLAGAWPGTPESIPERRLDVVLVDMKELVRRAFGEPLEAGVLVELLRGWRAPDRHLLLKELPWLHQVEDAERIIAALLEKGWAVLKCGSRTEADRLCSSFSHWAGLRRLGRR